MTESPDSQVQGLLGECARVLAERDWSRLNDLALQVLALDAPTNGAAQGFRALAIRHSTPGAPPPVAATLNPTPPPAPNATPQPPAPNPNAPPPIASSLAAEEPGAPQGSDAAAPPQASDGAAPPQGSDPASGAPPPPPERRTPAPSFAPPPRVTRSPEGAPSPPARDRFAGDAGSSGPVGGVPQPDRRNAGGSSEDLDIAALMRRASVAAEARDWREARRYARAALALSPDLVTARTLIAEADQALSAESLAAIQVAAQATQRQIADNRRRRPLAAFLGRFSRPGMFGGGTSLLPIAGAATLFVLAGLATFIAFGQLTGGDGDGSEELVANPTSQPAAGDGSSTPTPSPSPSVAGDSVVAPTIEAVGCTQLDDGVTFECRPTLDGDADTYAWTADGGAPPFGSGEVFRTVLPAGGPYRIALEACMGGACNSSESQAFVVSLDDAAEATPEPAVSSDPGSVAPPTSTPVAGPPPPPAPTISSVSCSPSPADVGQTVVCTGLYGGGDVESYDWSVNGIFISSSATLSGRYTTSGARTIGLQVCNAGGCVTDSVALTVQQPAVSNAPTINSIGCSPLAVQIGTAVNCRPEIEGEVDTYAWQSGATRRSTSTFFITYAIAGTRAITLEVCNDDGCDTAEASIAVTAAPPLPVAVLDVSTTSVAFGSTTAPRTITIQNDGQQTLNWTIQESLSWLTVGPTSGSVGSGSSTVTLTVLRTDFGPNARAGTFQITSNGGNRTISVTALPRLPDIAISCVPNPVALDTATNCTASSSAGAIGSYAWSHDGGGTGVESTFLATFATAGPHTVSLTATNAGGSDSASTSVTVLAPPTVTSIGCSPSSVASGGTVSCTPTIGGGVGPYTYAWGVTGGGAAVGSTTSSSFSATFTSAGSVTLVVTNAGGPSTQASFPVTITVAPPTVTSIGCSPSSVASGGTVSCTPTIGGGVGPYTYAWGVTGGGAAVGSTTSSSFSATFTSAGSVTLVVTNAGGPSTQASFPVTITVAPPTVTSIGCSPSSVASGGTVSCTPTIGGGVGPYTYAWGVTGGGAAVGSTTSSSFSATFTSAGSVTLVVTNAGGPSTQASFPVTITVAPPTITSIGCSPSSVESGGSVTCNAVVTGTGLSYLWGVTGGGVPVGPTTGSSFSATFTSEGSITLTVTNAGGSDGASFPVTITIPPQ